MKGRELSDEAVGYQVDAFLAWSEKRGTGGLTTINALALWVASKDFAPADLAAIMAELRRREALESVAPTAGARRG